MGNTKHCNSRLRLLTSRIADWLPFSEEDHARRAIGIPDFADGLARLEPGVRGGRVYGSTNENGGYVKEKPVSPADLSATILHHLGIDPQQTWADEFQNLPRKLSEGKVVRDLG